MMQGEGVKTLTFTLGRAPECDQDHKELSVMRIAIVNVRNYTEACVLIT